MVRKVALFVGCVCALAISSFADFNGKIRQVILCSDTRFEFECEGSTQNNQNIRYYVTTAVGTEKFKMFYSMALTAFTTRELVWVGANAAVANTGNCGANNAYGAFTHGMAIYRP